MVAAGHSCNIRVEAVEFRAMGAVAVCGDDILADQERAPFSESVKMSAKAW